jgi:hypothetical protein
LKKSIRGLIKIAFFLLLCSGINFKGYSQKNIQAESFNFSQLATRDASQTHHQSKEHEIDGGWRNLLGNMPIPSGAKIMKQHQLNAPATPTSVESASPPPLQGFLGHIDPLNFIPPDTHGAVGINNVVTATNEFIIVHAKNGGAVLNKLTYDAFFNATGMSDPYMQFDPYLNRYWISGISTSNPNKVFIAVSQTEDPSGSWYRYSFTPTSTDGSLLLDHPNLGYDNRLIVVSGIKFPGGNNFTGPILFVFDKNNLAAGNPISFGTNAQTLEKTAADGDVPCPVTAMNLTSPSTTFYIVQNWNGGSSAIRLSTLTGNIPSITWNTATAVFPSGGTPWTDSQLGNSAPQLDETRKLATNDARISSAQLVNGKIWCAHHIGLPATGFDHTAIQWWQLSTAGAVLQRGRIDDPNGLVSRYYPTIAVNSAENVLIGYTISSPTTRVSAAYSTRIASTPLNTTDDEYIFKGGISTYWKDYGSGRARWGDYSHSLVDPVNGDLWTIQQYADLRLSLADNDSRYGVWWAQVTFLTFDTDASLSDIIEPNGSAPYCNVPINPKVTIRNVGKDTLKSIKVGLILDGINVGVISINNLSIPIYNSQDADINFPLNPSPGNHILEAYTFEPNGVADQRISNDTSFVSFTVLLTLTLPDFEGFDTDPFPPAGGWTISNPDNDTTWAQTTLASKSGAGSMVLDAYDYIDLPGAVDILKSPRISLDGVDSININFDVAYAEYAKGDKDSLQIVYSTDCGTTWLPTSYRKGGAGLVTNGGALVPTFFIPTSSQWRNENVSISTCNLNSSSILIGVKGINGYGNNIYVDNLSISEVNIKQANAAVLSVNEPSVSLCTTDFTPEVTIANYGFDTLKSLKINYQVDNGTLSTFDFTGSISRCSTQIVTLNPVTSVSGNHILTVYSTEPNGIADQLTGNDTARKGVTISPIVDAPLFEGFETTTFPPDNWGIQNPDGSLTWEKTTAVAKTGTGALVIKNYDYPTANTADQFLSPVIKYNEAADSFFVSFDYAYSQGVQYPGSTNLPLDTLDVQITQDCGKTFTTIWKKWGADLQTIGDPNLATGTKFIPKSNQWKNINIYLNPAIGTNNFQVYFVAKSNKQNNLYLDNINIYTKILPKRLKNQGYLIYPSPFKNTFIVRNYQVPTTLQSIGVFNSVGQLVWSKELNGTGNTEMTVDLSNLAAGVYIIKLKYLERTVVERIVKQ